MSENLSIISSPPNIALINENLNFSIHSNREWNEDNASLTIILSDTQANYLNNYIELEFNNTKYKFYFRETPDETGLELRTWNSADDFSVFIEKLKTDLAKNYYINNNYIITSSTDKIIITARYSGPDYNITVSENTVNLPVIETLEGSNGTMPDDYKLYIAPFLFENGLNSLPVGEDLIPLNSDDNFEINISEYLKQYLESSFHYPFNGQTYYIVENACLKYFIKYAEYFNEKIKSLYNTYETPKYVVAGGLKQIDSDFLSNESTNFFDYNLNFLTHLNNKITYLNKPERLYYLNKDNENIKINIEGHKYLNNINYQTVKIKIDIPVEKFKIYEFCVGPNEIFSDIELENMTYYKIFISKDALIKEIEYTSIILSKEVIYTINKKYFKNIRTIFFKNSFNMFEPVHFTGNLSLIDDLKSTEIESKIESINKSSIYRKKINSKYLNSKYELSSGYINKEERNWLKDFLLSKQYYLVQGDFLLPIILDEGEFLNNKDEEYLYYLKIKFHMDVDNINYSNMINENVIFITDENFEIYTDENNIKLIE